MSGNNIVKLVFSSAAANSGFDSAIGKVNELMGGVGSLSKAAATLGSAFGSAGAAVGRVVSMLAQGSIWGAAAAGVGMVIQKVKEWRAEAAMAAEMQERAYKETAKAASEAAQQMKDAYAKAATAIDEAAKRKKADIELTKNLTKAELELAAAKKRAAGEETAALNLENKAKEAERRAAMSSAGVDVAAARQKVGAARKAAGSLPYIDRNSGEFDRYAAEEQRRLRNGRIMRASMKLQEMNNAITQDGLADRIKATEEELKLEEESKKKFIEMAVKARQAAANIKDAKKNLDDAVKQQAAVKKQQEKARVEERTAAAKAARDEEVKRIQAQMAALNQTSGTAQSSTGKWQSRFESAFALWQDPEAAQSARDQAAKRDEDMKRFRKAVGGYHAKWRIDEAARLMREGDEEGLQERLTQWRKGSRFNAQTEQMVLAAAAEQNKGQAERDIAEIAKNTRDLAKKLEQLVEVK